MANREKRCGLFGIAGKALFGVIAGAVFSLVFGAVVMVLWNWLMPMLFGLEAITFWQAFGILLLSKLLFGFGGFGHGRDAVRGGRDADFRRARWKAMRDVRRNCKTWEFDEVYEQWWESEGSASFKDYMNKRNADKEEQQP